MHSALPFIVLFISLFNCYCGADNEAKVVQYKSDSSGTGDYSFKFFLSDNTGREESGQFEGEDNYVVRGYYTYIDPDGDLQYVSYYADKTGYHPTYDLDHQKPSTPIPIVPFGGVPGALVATLLG